MGLSRRNFIALAGGGSLALGSLLSASSRITNSVVLERVPLSLKTLPKEFRGYRIGLVSDIHAGKCVSEECLSESLVLLEKERPDILLIAGDLIWNNDSPLTQASLSLSRFQNCMFSNERHARSIYRSISSAYAKIPFPDGIFAVPGNHDNWASGPIFEDALTGENIALLTNRSFSVRRGTSTLSIFGFDDFWTGIPRIPKDSPHQQANEVRIALSHNPDWLSYLIRTRAFHFDLGVCGHTHGGQIKIPGLGALFYNIQDLRLREGLAQVGDSFVYTTRGLGTVVIPLRINCPPELTIIELVES